MKFLIIDYYYPEFLNTFYNKNSNIDHKNYNELKKIIFDYCFGTANFYSTNLTKLGHITEEIIFNNEILQRQWAKEHGIKFFNGLFNDKLFLNKFFKLNWKEKIVADRLQSHLIPEKELSNGGYENLTSNVRKEKIKNKISAGPRLRPAI